MSTPPLKPEPTSLPSQSQQGTPQTAPPVGEDLEAKVSFETKSTEYVELPRGKELNEAAALNLANSRPVQWIVLAGPSGSGKTTLLTSLYELFQWRPVEGYEFAGSNTLPAFEERCYLSRLASGNEMPHTQRTPYKGPEPYYLHLRIRSTDRLRPFRDFLFTDVSGEMFEHARDSTTECKEMLFLRRARHFLLFLDSSKGIEEDKRWAMFEDSRGLLRSCVDSQMIGLNCKVNIVWSRFDYFAAAETDSKHQLFRSQVEKELRKGFHREIPNLIFSEVAARPIKVPTLGLGYGVPALLKRWAETPLKMKCTDLFPKSFLGRRESELFAARHFASMGR